MSSTARIAVTAPEALFRAARIIATGGVIVYPTDTLYGLGADATNVAAVARINRLKRRRGPLSVVAPDADTALDWTILTAAERELVREYLGGARTAIVPVRAGIVAPAVLGPDDTLGIRIPGQPFGPELAARTGVAIVTTSVNRAGRPPLNDPDRIERQFGRAIDLLVDAGQLPPSAGSVIYRWQGEHMELLKNRSL